MADVERATTLARMGWLDSFGWQELLKSRRVLIISEAGAGKTFECQRQAEMLWNQGEAAFYLELSALANERLEELLCPEYEERLEAWRSAQSEVATFFLDSIDELNLTLSTFEMALRRLRRAVVGRLGRVRVIITTRPIEIDQALIEQYLPIPPQEELVMTGGDAFADVVMGRKRQKKKSDEEVVLEWRHVTLMPLSDAQIEQMAVSEGVEHPKALLDHIHATNAEEFARRPQDLVELCATWRADRSIPTHREQVLQNIQSKLRVRSGRREPAELSPEKALAGACRLAFATLLSRKLTIRFSVEADRGGEPGTALDPELILSDWTRVERQALLERPLFGFASYGRVRFHHRSITEFLAAKWLASRLTQGMPIRSVKRLLFADTSDGFQVVRPTMRPVAAWLAREQQNIFSELCQREPEVLLDFADPESLSLSQRAEALRSYVHRYRDGSWWGIHTPRVQVERFASPELAGDVMDLWFEDVESFEVREFLLELIGAGPMPEGADLVYETARNQLAQNVERVAAIDALIRLGDPRVSLVVQSMLDSKSRWNSALVRAAVARLFPQHIDAEQMCDLLEVVESSDGVLDEFEWHIPRLVAQADFRPGYLEILRERLATKVISELGWEQRQVQISKNHGHLVSIIASVCLRLIREGGFEDTALLHSSVVALRLRLDSRMERDVVADLRREIEALSPPLREEVFWIEERLMRDLCPEMKPRDRFFEVAFDGALNLTEKLDDEWMRRGLATPDMLLQDREILLRGLMLLRSREPDSSRAKIESLRVFVTDEPPLSDLIDDFLNPPEPDPRSVKLQAQIEEQRKSQEEKEKKRRADWIAFWEWVAEHPETAFSPSHEGATAWNLWAAMEKDGDGLTSGWSRQFIESHFGREVADRLRETLHSIWRNEIPTLPSERPEKERNKIFVRWRLGLAAISAEAEDRDWAAKLSDDEAELAARYAPVQINGLPPWLDALVETHPDAVDRILGRELTSELEEPASPAFPTMLLQDLNSASEKVVSLFLPRLARWLGGFSGQVQDDDQTLFAAERLGRVLNLLYEHGDGDQLGRMYEAAQLHLGQASAAPFVPLWVGVLLKLNPAKGVEVVEGLLKGVEPSAEGFAVNLIGSLFGDRHGGARVDLKRSEFEPGLLLRLVQLAYKHVRRGDDVEHEGAFTPGPRDAAESARGALLDAVIKSSGPRAWAVKSQLLQDPLVDDFRDWLKIQIRERAAAEADALVRTESAFTLLEQHGEVPPENRSEMFDVLVGRLEDLEEMLLEDDSPRAGWAQVGEERIMRQFIAHELKRTRRSAYVLDQESVTADEKETDIRLRAQSGQQAVIELKIGERWSGRVLRDTIRKQLVDKYMADETCGSGCLLVTVSTYKGWEHPETGERIDADGLQEMLDREAENVVDERGGEVKLLAKVLNLQPRLTKEGMK
ncbi:hypothetical protein LV475_03390 [Guyparkeria hydrothermalis]|uniref:NACHT domain-containing protein n=1 Tax=Guyparkeria hydrothermalis TaxID=923 RepID=UPI00202226AF|nr:hypothetical protein [Guyparkeria hydrothermalis]MCL7750648.1 hypothetical protein [Guyparkeria hydrothermalis]